jgi:nicotinate-nucleotide pyrophosphorylase (carboxylating)
MFEQNESLSQAITRNVRDALTEDLGTGDWTAQLVPEDRQGHAKLIVRQEAV